VKLRRRLLAGGASVHIDFHADRHFDDLGGFPGHFGSPCNRTNFVLRYNLVSFEKFASEIFGSKVYDPLWCSAKGTHGFVRASVKPKTDQRVQTRPRRPGRSVAKPDLQPV
jgi:hypothetical protein